MTILEKEFSVAQCTLGVDLLAIDSAAWINKIMRKRVVAIGLVGCNAIDEMKADLVYGSVKMGEITNNSTGLTLDTDRDLIPTPSAIACEAQEKIALVVTKVPTVSPCKLHIVIEELP